MLMLQCRPFSVFKSEIVMKIVCNLLNGSFNKSVANILATILSIKGGCLILCPELAAE